MGARIRQIRKLFLRWWPAHRTAVLSVLGFGFVSAAGWAITLPLGLLLVGLSCLALEALTRGDH